MLSPEDEALARADADLADLEEDFARLEGGGIGDGGFEDGAPFEVEAEGAHGAAEQKGHAGIAAVPGAAGARGHAHQARLGRRGAGQREEGA